jgi:hypothetical protein
MMISMASSDKNTSINIDNINEITRRIINEHNALVHAEPNGARRHLAKFGSTLGYSPSKSLNEPERCDRLCGEAMTYLAVLTLRDCAIFGPK